MFGRAQIDPAALDRWITREPEWDEEEADDGEYESLSELVERWPVEVPAYEPTIEEAEEVARWTA